MTTSWKSQAICKSLTLRIARATAFAVATYGCESWGILKESHQESRGILNVYIRATAASTMAAAQDQRLDLRTIKYEANASETNEEKED